MAAGKVTVLPSRSAAMMLRPLLSTEASCSCTGAGTAVTQAGTVVAVMRFSTKGTGLETISSCTFGGTWFPRFTRVWATPGEAKSWER